ncbi:hypothetical protein KJ816_02770 [Patescibacteria group bacterium]|nr:hypothetical protein [Patescibacteria group bacterium]
MLKNENFRLVLISLIFSASVLVILPRIEIYVSNKLLKVDSYVGGYSPKIFGKVIDLSDFKKGMDVGGMERVVFTIGDAGTENVETNSQLVKEITEKRMKSGGYKEYQVYISKTDGKYQLVVEVPKYVDINYLAVLLNGTGNLTFKTLKNPAEWGPEEAARLVASPDSWLPTDISRSDVSDLAISKGSTGQDQLQIIFKPEGKAKFNKVAKENVNKPVAFFINDQDFPVLITVIDESLAADALVDPTLTGYFPQGFLQSFLIQYKNGPLPVKLFSPEAFDVAPKFGSNFIEKFGLALLVGFSATLILSLIRFKKEGILLSMSVFLSICLFLALVKVFSVSVNFALVAGTLTALLLFVEKGYEILYKIKLEESKDKPFGYVIEKVFGEQGDIFKYVIILLFFTMLLVLRSAKGELVSFIYSIVIGCLCLPYLYFVFKTLLETSGGKKK